MDVYGYIWVYMDIYEYIWIFPYISIYIYIYPYISINIHVYPYISIYIPSPPPPTLLCLPRRHTPPWHMAGGASHSFARTFHPFGQRWLALWSTLTYGRWRVPFVSPHLGQRWSTRHTPLSRLSGGGAMAGGEWRGQHATLNPKPKP